MGFFSWKTQDTHESIPNIHSNRPTFTVYMINPVTGEQYKEDNYDGYGIFGGKDYYELVAELNGKTTRYQGINLFHNDPNAICPILVEDPTNWETYKGQKPEDDPDQGYFYMDDEGDPDQDYTSQDEDFKEDKEIDPLVKKGYEQLVDKLSLYAGNGIISRDDQMTKVYKDKLNAFIEKNPEIKGYVPDYIDPAKVKHFKNWLQKTLTEEIQESLYTKLSRSIKEALE